MCFILTIFLSQHLKQFLVLENFDRKKKTSPQWISFVHDFRTHPGLGISLSGTAFAYHEEGAGFQEGKPKQSL